MVVTGDQHTDAHPDVDTRDGAGHRRRDIHATILLLAGGTLLRLAWTGGYTNYVKPGARPFLYAAGAVILTVALAIGWLSVRPAPPPAAHHDAAGDDGHHHHRGFDIGWLLVVPMAVLLLFAPPAIGSYEAARSGSALPPAPSSPYPPLPAGDPIRMSVVDYACRAVFDAGRTLEGRQVTLTGFLTGAPGGGRRGARSGPAPSYPIFVTDKSSVDEWLMPVPGEAGTFQAGGRSTNGEADAEVKFIPFYRMYGKRYGIYWDILTSADWDKRASQLAAEQTKQQKLAAATVGFAQPGEMQPERDFNYQAGEESQPVRAQDRAGRRAATWFSFDLPVDEAHPLGLVVTYRNDEQANRKFELQVDGKKIGEQAIDRASPQEQNNFFDVEYVIPAELVKGKQKVTVRFQAADGSEVARVFGIRMIRTDADR
jgi:hypothetical protein